MKEQRPYLTINGQNIYKMQVGERLANILKTTISSRMYFKRNGKKITAEFTTIDNNGDIKQMKCTIEYGCLISNIRNND